jgi:hypothetical protein
MQTLFLCLWNDKTSHTALCIILCIVGKFNWKGTIKAVLKQAPDNEISVKKLKKKVHPITEAGMEQLGRGVVFMYVCM